MNWEIVIGLETHVQLNTHSKIFSGAPTAFGAPANTQACAVDIALPGVLPVLNRGAVERAIKFGLSVGATIAPRSIFARKNYFYPDSPKGYQISQYELPVVNGGTLCIQVGQQTKTIQLTRAHLEEDAGKSLHENFHGKSGIDLNRAGTPLLEVVTEPDMRSAGEAVAYARALHALVRWIDICDGNMQEGSFRCDANVSVRRHGTEKLGTRCEIKNLNSFRFLEKAIEFEAARQIEVLEEGGTIRQETRLYDADKNETRPMRSKEDAQDYRYFPDPDLLPLEINSKWIEEIKASMPELPTHMRQRLQNEYGLSDYDAIQLTTTLDTARYYEHTLALTGQNNAKLCANWIMGELSARLNKEDIDIAVSPVTPALLAGLIHRIADNTISNKTGKEVFDALWLGAGKNADTIIETRSLKQISNTDALEQLIDDTLAKNPQSVAEFKAGKEKAFNALIGQIMKMSHGQANPQQVNELLRKKLG